MIGWKYVFGMLLFCFLIWATVVDNFVIPKPNQLKQDDATYSSYEVVKRTKYLTIGPYSDDLVIYAHIDGRKQTYYMEYFPAYLEALLILEKEKKPPIVVHYTKRFPKIWKNYAYEVRFGEKDQSGKEKNRFGYISSIREEKQLLIWEFTGLMCGVYLVILLLGYYTRPELREETPATD